MAAIKPANLVLRCYAHQKKNGKWYGVCLELNLAAEAKDPDELKEKLSDMIETYIDAVFDTEDTDSIPKLFHRRAPVKDWLFYLIIWLFDFIKKFPSNFIFNGLIKVHPIRDTC
jgi:hypothetical protein